MFFLWERCREHCKFSCNWDFPCKLGQALPYSATERQRCRKLLLYRQEQEGQERQEGGHIPASPIPPSHQKKGCLRVNVPRWSCSELVQPPHPSQATITDHVQAVLPLQSSPLSFKQKYTSQGCNPLAHGSTASCGLKATLNSLEEKHLLKCFAEQGWATVLGL